MRVLPGRFRASKVPALAWGGLGVVVALLAAAALAPAIAPYPVDAVDVVHQLEPPSARHWLGTDENGTDVLTLLLYGARAAAFVGLTTVLVCATVGTALGALAGYYGGWIDEVVMRVTDTLMAFPGILLAILIIFITQEPSLLAVVGALAVSGWSGYARLVRGQVLVERELAYVEASRALGFPVRFTLFREVVPNVLAPVIVQATFGVAGAILAEASLSFLGLGPQDQPSWGALLDQGATYFLLTPHLAVFPGVAIMVTVLSINFLGDALRDVLDPREVV
jgi:peptide/nickel transport system permease protein